jgi:hypothetical protein
LHEDVKKNIASVPELGLDAANNLEE